jgi:hypothetical protein
MWKVRLALYMLHSRHTRVRGWTSLTPHVGIRWRWSPSYPSHFPPNETTPMYALNRMLVGPYSPTRPSGGAKHLLSLPGSEPRIVQVVIHQLWHLGSVTDTEGRRNINAATNSQSSYFLIETKEG